MRQQNMQPVWEQVGNLEILVRKLEGKRPTGDQ
jgi:hypothetical protein